MTASDWTMQRLADLLDAVLGQRECIAFESADDGPVAVHYGDWYQDQIGFCAEGRGLRREIRLGTCGRRRSDGDDSHGAESSPTRLHEIRAPPRVRASRVEDCSCRSEARGTTLPSVRSIFQSPAALDLENLALRHQFGVLRRAAAKRLKLTSAGRLFWICLSRLWHDWRSALAIVKPETVIAWHRAGFRLFWTWKVRCGQPGRPIISPEVRALIRKMGREKPSWGAPRIHGELLKLGINVGESSVSKYMVRSRKPPSQTWRTFLQIHAKQLVSIDFFTVPTIRFQVLYVFLVLAHDRRRILHFNVTAHPTAAWTGQQLREAFPFDQLPRYLLRDRDAIFDDEFREQVRGLGICEVLSAPRSPWQRAYVERVIGSVRRECLDHVIVFHESSLRRILTSYFDYYHRSRTHLSLGKDSPEPRAIQPPEMGSVVVVPQVGGLHHRYERRAA
jgi:transposase InsO family protein